MMFSSALLYTKFLIAARVRTLRRRLQANCLSLVCPRNRVVSGIRVILINKSKIECVIKREITAHHVIWQQYPCKYCENVILPSAEEKPPYYYANPKLE